MTSALTTTWNIDALEPFGLLSATKPGADIYAVPTLVLLNWVIEHRVLILRGFDPLVGDALLEFCGTLGALSLASTGRKDALMGTPLRWSFSFANQIPRYLLYHCDEAPPPEFGGQMLFCDTTRLLEHAAPAELALFRGIEVTYESGEDMEGSNAVTVPFITPHPYSGEETLRFCEPPGGPVRVRLRISGIVEEAEALFIAEMRRRFRDPKFCLSHTWKRGDIVIADNDALLYASRPLRPGASRKIRRIDIL